MAPVGAYAAPVQVINGGVGFEPTHSPGFALPLSARRHDTFAPSTGSRLYISTNNTYSQRMYDHLNHPSVSAADRRKWHRLKAARDKADKEFKPFDQRLRNRVAQAEHREKRKRADD